VAGNLDKPTQRKSATILIVAKLKTWPPQRRFFTQKVDITPIGKARKPVIPQKAGKSEFHTKK